MDLAHLLTEQHRPELSDLDLRSTRDLVDLMVSDHQFALSAVADVAPDIEGAIATIKTVSGRLER